MHAAGVQNNICAFWYLVTIYDIIREGSSHGEVHHRVKAQALVDEALQHLQLLKVPVLELSLACGETVALRYHFAQTLNLYNI